MKTKIYSVPVSTTTSADYIIEATSKEEAYHLVEKEMEISLQRQMKKVVPHPQIKNLRAYTGVTAKSMIQIIK